MALKIYGDERHTATLLGANPAMCGMTVFTGGEVINAPDVDVPEGDGAGTPFKAPWK